MRDVTRSRLNKLIEITNELSAFSGFESALQFVAKSICELCRADSSVIFPFDQQTNFSGGIYYPSRDYSEINLPRDNGLTSGIISSGEPFFCEDTTEKSVAKLVDKAKGSESQALSMMGIPLKVKDEVVGVMYARGKAKKQFDQDDFEFLKLLAAQTSIHLGWSRYLLGPIEKVEKVTSKLFSFRQNLKSVCENIVDELQAFPREFRFAAIQLYRPEEATIDTVEGSYGAAIDKRWTGLSRHYVDKNHTAIRDIQADIVSSEESIIIDIVTGWIKKFDRWVYDEFNHKYFLRIWIPIILVGDENGKIVEDWYNHWDIETFNSGKQFDSVENRYGYMTRVIMKRPQSLQENVSWNFRVIGTIECGYYVPDLDYEALKNVITVEDAIGIAKKVGELSMHIYHGSLDYVFDTITAQAKQIVGSKSASLHFLRKHTQSNPQHIQYTYTSCSGHLCQQFLRECPIHRNGLGQSAVADRIPKFVPDPHEGHQDDSLSVINEHVYSQGIRAMAAFPLLIPGTESKASGLEGILYVHYDEVHRFNIDEINWIHHFANRATNAIQAAIHYTRQCENTNTLASLNAVSHSLADQPQSEYLLQSVAGTTKNVLAADIVSIYEYNAELGFFYSPKIAGKLIHPKQTIKDAQYKTGPYLLVEQEQEIYFSHRSQTDKIMNNPSRDSKVCNEVPFVIREDIQSSVGIVLKVEKKLVGAMFVHYRRPYGTPDEGLTNKDLQLISTLSYSAAIAIKNRKSYMRIETEFERTNKEFNALKAIEEAILSSVKNPQEVLSLILNKALSITEATAGSVFFLNKWSNNLELIVQRGFPEDHRCSTQKLGEGIVGIAAKNRSSILVPDVTAEPWCKVYKRVVPATRSELAIILEDHQGLRGVLNVEHPQAGKLNAEDRRALEAFAVQVMIALQSVELYQKLKGKIRPIRTLSRIAARIQNTNLELSKVLRMLLTGVTANQGLGFSRAMLFEFSKRENKLFGKVAVGSCTHDEAVKVWDDIEVERKSKKVGNDSQHLSFLLDQLESDNFKYELKHGGLDNAIRGLEIDAYRVTGAIQTCVIHNKTVVVDYDDHDPLRVYLEQVTNTDSNNYAFACIPVIGKEAILGMLVIDNRFLISEKSNDFDTDTLELYAGVIAMAMENVKLQAQLASKQKEEHWKEFTAKIVHIIGTRIATISGAASRLKTTCIEDTDLNEISDNHVFKYIDQLDQGINDTKKALQELKEFSLPYTMELENFQLGKLLTDILDDLCHVSECSVELLIKSEHLLMRGDSSKIRDAILELTKNAGYAMKEKATESPKLLILADKLAVSTNAASVLLLEISDNGPGVAKNIKNKLFEPYYTSKSKSNGLGLSITKKIVEEHKGEIEEIGELGEGAKFVIKLPALR